MKYKPIVDPDSIESAIGIPVYANVPLSIKQTLLEKDVAAAKRELHNETLELVAMATGKVVGKTHTADADQALIKEALKEAK